eukprot:m.10336 g.10336  ORF g.10336 m.10336 type:complete len:273 (-) comp2735_c0_seq1:253-1071(-)
MATPVDVADGTLEDKVLIAGVWQAPASSHVNPLSRAQALATVASNAHPSKVELLVFPELYLTGYGDDAGANALSPESDVLQRVATAARDTGVAIAVGFAEAAPSGDVYNSCVVYDALGMHVITYRKVNLWGPWEAKSFSRGDTTQLRSVPVTLRGGHCVRVGVLICYDLEFPEPARCLALDGARVLIAPTALGDRGPVSRITPHCVVPTRANENHVFVLYSNFEGSSSADAGGPGENPQFCGRSAIVNSSDLTCGVHRRGQRTVVACCWCMS